MQPFNNNSNKPKFRVVDRPLPLNHITSASDEQNDVLESPNLNDSWKIKNDRLLRYKKLKESRDRLIGSKDHNDKKQNNSILEPKLDIERLLHNNNNNDNNSIDKAHIKEIVPHIQNNNSHLNADRGEKLQLLKTLINEARRKVELEQAKYDAELQKYLIEEDYEKLQQDEANKIGKGMDINFKIHDKDLEKKDEELIVEESSSRRSNSNRNRNNRNRNVLQPLKTISLSPPSPLPPLAPLAPQPKPSYAQHGELHPSTEPAVNNNFFLRRPSQSHSPRIPSKLSQTVTPDDLETPPPTFPSSQEEYDQENGRKNKIKDEIKENLDDNIFLDTGERKKEIDDVIDDFLEVMVSNEFESEKKENEVSIEKDNLKSNVRRNQLSKKEEEIQKMEKDNTYAYHNDNEDDDDINIIFTYISTKLDVVANKLTDLEQKNSKTSPNADHYKWTIVILLIVIFAMFSYIVSD
ncbi:hypothetical protein PACTADRAFT_48105 [Pachysolen tannophilus NRRL Y-2460]|uniref:Uncharacterized protein n=1 Tax=Pachysolen tannophilus NRRL Y-2460 TaxID=669874 RepID=A0A1E4U2V4_PACTA|nr:hypothetical protein PACTADRAFT_48105 [Pachysolen tannophilus NRRL Y-2460]